MTHRNFEDAWSKRIPGKYGKANVLYISLNDLIRNKEEANMEQDKADLKYLRKTKNKGK